MVIMDVYMRRQGGELGRTEIPQPDVGVNLFGKAVLHRWVQLPGQEDGNTAPSVGEGRPGWRLDKSREGVVMPVPQAALRGAEEDGVRIINFMSKHPWSDDEMDNAYPRRIELGVHKVETRDGRQILAEWVLEAMQEDGEAA